MNRLLPLLIALLPLGLACQPSPKTQDPAPSPAQADSAPTANPPTNAPAAPPSSAPASAPDSAPTSNATMPAAHCQAVAQLNAMDPRRPVPLQPMMAWHQKQNMQEHLVAIEGIVAALANEDWEAVKKASASIESSPQMQQMCQHMGAGAEGFTQMALDFHTRADGIAEAATAKDVKATLKATAHTLQACTSCHAAFRQDVIDAKSWQERTGQNHVPGKGH